MSEMDWLDIFGDNLIDMLKEARMSQRELADESGLSEATVSAYINKKKIPGLRAIINMAYALNCSTDELIDFGDQID